MNHHCLAYMCQRMPWFTSKQKQKDAEKGEEDHQDEEEEEYLRGSQEILKTLYFYAWQV